MIICLKISFDIQTCQPPNERTLYFANNKAMVGTYSSMNGVLDIVFGICREVPADLCLTGLQISTNEHTTRKCIWGSIHFVSVPRKEIHSVKK